MTFNEGPEMHYYQKRRVIVHGFLLTVENGPEVATWCGGSWHPYGPARLGEGDVPIPTEELSWPQLWMPLPPNGAGLPIAYAVRDDYEGDHVLMGVKGEFYVSVPRVFPDAYDILAIGEPVQ